MAAELWFLIRITPAVPTGTTVAAASLTPAAKNALYWPADGSLAPAGHALRDPAAVGPDTVRFTCAAAMPRVGRPARPPIWTSAIPLRRP